MILHVVPAKLRGLYGAGNWKDIRAFEMLLEDEGLEYESVHIDAAAKLPRGVLAPQAVHDVVIQYSFRPELIDQSRNLFPRARIHVRAHNAEALQHLHRENPDWKPSYRNARSLYGAARLLLNDTRCKLRADSILGISEWDVINYWSRLPGAAQLHILPYHSPWPVIRRQVSPLSWQDRCETILCMPGGEDRISISQRRAFVRLAREANALPDAASRPWSFELSPGIGTPDGDDLGFEPVRILDRLEEPWDKLCSVKALAIMTPLGFGMKTTIVDALAAGCRVLVDGRLVARLHRNLRRYCQVVDVSSRQSVRRALHSVRVEGERNIVNEALRIQAGLVVRQVFVTWRGRYRGGSE